MANYLRKRTQSIYILFLTYLTIKEIKKMEQEIKEIRTAKITQKGQISIPSIARQLAGFKEGTKISIAVYADRVELRPLKKENINEALLCMLASESALAKNWLSKEDEEAWKDL
jgi:AbrB family looped-hinge helix DNA binding protein